MNGTAKLLSLMTLYCALSGTAGAQQPDASPAASRQGADAPADSGAPATPAAKPSKGTAQSEAGEPRADTSNSQTAGSEASTADTASRKASSPDAEASSGRAHAPSPTSADRRARASGSEKPGPKVDRLNLGVATVTGDREQPKVMYVVPWKKSDIGDLAGKPMNSLVDEILAPVDRDVFKREVVYYHAVQADTSQNGAPPKPVQQGEK